MNTQTDVDQALAAKLVQQALAEVAREATRAGREAEFACLKPFLQADPTEPEMEQLAQVLALSMPAIELALGSLRRRLRERVEAAIRKRADTPESRDTLRRRILAALTESTP